jgi:hypothetical protein
MLKETYLNHMTQPDSIVPDPGNPQALNRYSYALNNPIKYTDPTGHRPIIDEDEYGNPIVDPDWRPVGNRSRKDKDDINSDGNNNLDFTGYLADVMTSRLSDPRFISMQYSLFGTGKWIGLLYLEFTKQPWDIKQKIGVVSKGIALCTDQNECHYYDYSTPGNIQFGYLVGVLGLNKKITDAIGGRLNTWDVESGTPDATMGPCRWCDDPSDQAAVDFGYHLASSYPNGITREQLATELGNSPLTASFQPPPVGWVPPFPAIPGPTIYGPNDFDN